MRQPCGRSKTTLLILFTAQIRKAIDSLAIIIFVGLQTKKRRYAFPHTFSLKKKLYQLATKRTNHYLAEAEAPDAIR